MLVKNLLFPTKTFPFFIKKIGGSRTCFILMSNARAGSSFLQSSLSRLGAYGDFEFAWRPFNAPMPHQRFLNSGITNIRTELEKHIPGDQKIFGSKLTLPIFEFLSDAEANAIIAAIPKTTKSIHLIRHYWDLLKSNLSRGVAHDFDTAAKGWGQNSEMYKAYSQLPHSELGKNKPSVFVGISKSALKEYLINLIRNDFIFRRINQNNKGLIIVYEELQQEDIYKRLLRFLSLPIDSELIKDVIQQPSLRKLPPIPDENLPYGNALREATESCYQLQRKAGSAYTIYEKQLALIDHLLNE